MARKYLKGKFVPRNPEKYAGNVENIIVRSSYELKLLDYLDKHPDVITYASEELAIPYISPLDDPPKVRNYYPDIIAKVKDKTGNVATYMIEVKPENQVRPPIRGKKSQNTIMEEFSTYAINTAKWEAANRICEERGWKFRIFTEKELGIYNKWRL